MAPATAYLARKSLTRSVRAGLSASRLSGAAALGWAMLVRIGGVLRAAAATVREAQELRRKMLRRYPFMDV
jgi:hypothetical protein